MARSERREAGRRTLRETRGRSIEESRSGPGEDAGVERAPGGPRPAPPISGPAGRRVPFRAAGGRASRPGQNARGGAAERRPRLASAADSPRRRRRDDRHDDASHDERVQAPEAHDHEAPTTQARVPWDGPARRNRRPKSRTSDEAGPHRPDERRSCSACPGSRRRGLPRREPGHPGPARSASRSPAREAGDRRGEEVGHVVAERRRAGQTGPRVSDQRRAGATARPASTCRGRGEDPVVPSGRSRPGPIEPTPGPSPTG